MSANHRHEKVGYNVHERTVRVFSTEIERCNKTFTADNRCWCIRGGKTRDRKQNRLWECMGEVYFPTVRALRRGFGEEAGIQRLATRGVWVYRCGVISSSSLTSSLILFTNKNWQYEKKLDKTPCSNKRSRYPWEA